MCHPLDAMFKPHATYTDQTRFSFGAKVLHPLLVVISFLSVLIIFTGCDKGSDATAIRKTPVNADNPLKPGEPAPNFELELLDLSQPAETHRGKKVSLSDYRGKIILLNVWARWCVPCVAEMPAIERLQTQFRDQGFVVLGVNVDSPGARGRVMEFVQQHGLSFPILLDPNFSIPELYLLSGFPETIFIGRDGKLLGFTEPGASEPRSKIVGDRPWDSPAYVEAVHKLIED